MISVVQKTIYTRIYRYIVMEKILISIDKNLLFRIDKECERLGHGSKRSGYIRDACEFYLDTTRGIKNKLLKSKLEKELNEDGKI